MMGRKVEIENAVLICGDAREELLPLSAESIITDPVWPNALDSLPGAEDPYRLFGDVASLFPERAERLVVHMGCDSDPRFLSAIPPSFPFLRVCWLEFARPSYKGRLLNGAEAAYVFGRWSKSKPGARVLPGKVWCTTNTKKHDGHPCPRRQEHVDWLVKWYGGESVIDPFMGSGTTGIACAKLGIPFTGIEINPEFFDDACRRIEAAVLVAPSHLVGQASSPAKTESLGATA